MDLLSSVDRGRSHQRSSWEHHIWKQGISKQCSQHSKSQSSSQSRKNIQDGVRRGGQEDAAPVCIWTLRSSAPSSPVWR